MSLLRASKRPEHAALRSQVHPSTAIQFAIALLDHLIRSLQERRRNRQAERLGGLEVEDDSSVRATHESQMFFRVSAFHDPLHQSPGSHFVHEPNT